MKLFKLFLLFVLSLIIIGCCQTGVTKNTPGSESDISAAQIKQDLDFLASDSLKGRDTPSTELNIAAKYIASEFAKSNIKPVDGSYFQTVHMGKISLATDNLLKINIGGKEKSYKIKSQFVPFEMTANKTATAPLVFAGYGIDAPEYGYNDYENLDVKDKIVLILKHEPGEDDPLSKFNSKKATKYSTIKEKVNTAIDHGAAGVLVVQDPLNHMLLSPTGFPWPSLSGFIPMDVLPLTLLSDEKDKIPSAEVGEDVVVDLFGSIEKLKEIQLAIDKSFKTNSFPITDAIVSLKTDTFIKQMISNNVVGYAEGNDPKLKDEFVIIGAHYDHVGYKKNHNPGEDYIYNGADDNASGTAAMISAARAFGTASLKPKRSILFIAFCGEEKGLFGSRYYVDNPLIPLQKTIAMLNIDMIGRNSIDSLYIYGYSKSPGLKQVVEEANKMTKFTLIFNENLLQGGSDHMSFMQKKVPSIFFHSGTENEYHTVHDEAGLINFEKAKKVTKLVFETALMIANGNDYYKFIED